MSNSWKVPFEPSDGMGCVALVAIGHMVTEYSGKFI
jgi:hypothetical protein